jgi:hypothetical protein
MSLSDPFFADDIRARAITRLWKQRKFRFLLLTYLLVNSLLVILWALLGAGFFWPVLVLAGGGIWLVALGSDAFRTDDPDQDAVQAEMDRLRERSR